MPSSVEPSAQSTPLTGPGANGLMGTNGTDAGSEMSGALDGSSRNMGSSGTGSGSMGRQINPMNMGIQVS